MLDFQNLNITPEILHKINKIDAFKFAWENKHQMFKKIVFPAPLFEYIEEENRVSTAETDDPIMEIFFKNLYIRVHNKDEKHNYINLLAYIYNNYQNMVLTEDCILDMHLNLFRNATKGKNFPQKYKIKKNYLSVYDRNHTVIKTVFEPADPDETPKLMQKLVLSLKNLDNSIISHPIIVIAIFIYNFLAIHPFDDGNGRIARALIILLMMKAGYIYMPYSSLEAIFLASRPAHYRALWMTQQTLKKNAANYQPWLFFFVSILEKQVCHLENLIQKNLE